MTPAELLTMFREEMGDEVAPFLWSSVAAYRYMNEAQQMFCRLTEGIEDARTVSITRLSVVPDTEWYALSPLVLKVRGVTRTDTGRVVPVYPSEKTEPLGIFFDGRTGVLRALVSGLSKGQLRTWPMPSETVTLALSVFRLPQDEVDANGEFEIDDQHHMALLHWMKHKAYGKQDAETFDRTKAAEFEGRFRAYCAEARKEQERARRSAGTVMYGGI
jgi:hypothetical protein